MDQKEFDQTLDKMFKILLISIFVITTVLVVIGLLLSWSGYAMDMARLICAVSGCALFILWRIKRH